MRYQEWDVLLFPEDSKTPIQEFKTQCFVTKDYESTFLSCAALSGLPHSAETRSLTQLPVLTCFVPSLPQSAPFRISIHTWDKPKASRTTEALMQPEDAVVFEARVYIDGLFVCGSIFDSRSNWPQVINTCSQLDKDGNPDVLHFPPFHQEILQQSHWDAGEMLGRVRVVVAEGFARLRRIPPFERVKDIVAFSFQHAPLNVLEFSAIAWPNASMWAQAQSRQVYNAPRPSIQYDQKHDEDAHAHSPNRPRRPRDNCPEDTDLTTGAPWSNRAPPRSSLAWNNSGTNAFDAMSDPFIDLELQTEQFSQPRWNHKSSIEDVSMADYRSHTESNSSRALSTMTGISYDQRPPMSVDVDDAAMAELIEGLSPLKGTHAPTNTPAGEQTDTATLQRPSAAAKAREASYGNSLRGKKEGRHKENDSSAISSRLPSQAGQTRVDIVKADVEPLCESKRNRSANNTPDGRKATENQLVSPTVTINIVADDEQISPDGKSASGS